MFKQLKLHIEKNNPHFQNFTKSSFYTLKKFNFIYYSYLGQFRFLEFFDNVPSRIIIEDNYYTTKQPLIFKNGKLTLLNSVNSKIIQTNISYSKLSTSLIVILFSIGLITFFKFSVKISAILTIAGLGLSLYKYKLYKSFYPLIIELNLLENGKFVEIVTLANKFEVDIKFLNKPSKIQISTFNILIPELINSYNPLIIENGSNKGIFLIPAEENAHYNKELLNAVIYKSYIVAKNKLGKNDLIIENCAKI